MATELRIELTQRDDEFRCSISSGTAGSLLEAGRPAGCFTRAQLCRALDDRANGSRIKDNDGVDLWNLLFADNRTEFKVIDRITKASSDDPLRCRFYTENVPLDVPIEFVQYQDGVDHLSEPLVLQDDVTVVREHRVKVETPRLESGGQPVVVVVGYGGDKEGMDPGYFSSGIANFCKQLKGKGVTVFAIQPNQDGRLLWGEVIAQMEEHHRKGGSLVHVSLWCHGSAEGAGLLFSDPDWITADVIAPPLVKFGCQTLLLRACYSAVPTADHLGGLAGQLVERGIPVVVAMTGAVMAETTGRFAFKLAYRLARHQGRWVDQIVKESLPQPLRWGSWQNDDWAMVTTHFAHNFDGSLPLPSAPRVVEETTDGPWAAWAVGDDLRLVEARGAGIGSRAVGDGVGGGAWASMGATVPSFTLTPDGTALVALLAGRFLVAEISRDGRVTRWEVDFQLPAPDCWLVAARRSGPSIHVFVAGREGLVELRVDRGGYRQVSAPLPARRLTSGAALIEELVKVNAGRLQGQSPAVRTLRELISTETWVDIDAAVGGGVTMVAALCRLGTSAEDRAMSLHLVRTRGGVPEVRTVPLASGADRVAVARTPVMGEEPRWVLVSDADGEVRGWQWDSLGR